MAYTWRFSSMFAVEFANFPQDQQDAILDFTDIFEKHGLADFSKYPGKITYSWKGLQAGSAEFVYAQSNDLWHYHVGIPHYNHVHPKYATSDWVLHFQWQQQGTHVNLVDIFQHYTSTGKFYMPPPPYLKP